MMRKDEDETATKDSSSATLDAAAKPAIVDIGRVISTGCTQTL
jgi:hypothetical protein